MATKKTNTVAFRVTEEDHERFRKAAEYRGLELSAWLRQLATVDARAIETERMLSRVSVIQRGGAA